jgi:hypothetical protein
LNGFFELTQLLAFFDGLGLCFTTEAQKVSTLPERAKKVKSKATGKPVIEAYRWYAD